MSAGRRSRSRGLDDEVPPSPGSGRGSRVLSPNSLAGYVDTTDDEDDPRSQDQHRTPPRRPPNPNDLTSPDSLAGYADSTDDEGPSRAAAAAAATGRRGGAGRRRLVRSPSPMTYENEEAPEAAGVSDEEEESEGEDLFGDNMER